MLESTIFNPINTKYIPLTTEEKESLLEAESFEEFHNSFFSVACSAYNRGVPWLNPVQSFVKKTQEFAIKMKILGIAKFDVLKEMENETTKFEVFDTLLENNIWTYIKILSQRNLPKETLDQFSKELEALSKNALQQHFLLNNQEDIFTLLQKFEKTSTILALEKTKKRCCLILATSFISQCYIDNPTIALPTFATIMDSAPEAWKLFKEMHQYNINISDELYNYFSNSVKNTADSLWSNIEQKLNNKINELNHNTGKEKKFEE